MGKMRFARNLLYLAIVAIAISNINTVQDEQKVKDKENKWRGPLPGKTVGPDDSIRFGLSHFLNVDGLKSVKLSQDTDVASSFEYITPIVSGTNSLVATINDAKECSLPLIAKISDSLDKFFILCDAQRLYFVDAPSDRMKPTDVSKFYDFKQSHNEHKLEDCKLARELEGKALVFVVCTSPYVAPMISGTDPERKPPTLYIYALEHSNKGFSYLSHATVEQSNAQDIGSEMEIHLWAKEGSMVVAISSKNQLRAWTFIFKANAFLENSTNWLPEDSVIGKPQGAVVETLSDATHLYVVSKGAASNSEIEYFVSVCPSSTEAASQIACMTEQSLGLVSETENLSWFLSPNEEGELANIFAASKTYFSYAVITKEGYMVQPVMSKSTNFKAAFIKPSAIFMPNPNRAYVIGQDEKGQSSLTEFWLNFNDAYALNINIFTNENEAQKGPCMIREDPVDAEDDDLLCFVGNKVHYFSMQEPAISFSIPKNDSSSPKKRAEFDFKVVAAYEDGNTSETTFQLKVQYDEKEAKRLETYKGYSSYVKSHFEIPLYDSHFEMNSPSFSASMDGAKVAVDYAEALSIQLVAENDAETFAITTSSRIKHAGDNYLIIEQEDGFIIAQLEKTNRFSTKVVIAKISLVPYSMFSGKVELHDAKILNGYLVLLLGLGKETTIAVFSIAGISDISKAKVLLKNYKLEMKAGALKIVNTNILFYLYAQSETQPAQRLYYGVLKTTEVKEFTLDPVFGSKKKICAASMKFMPHGSLHFVVLSKCPLEETNGEVVGLYQMKIPNVAQPNEVELVAYTSLSSVRNPRICATEGHIQVIGESGDSVLAFSLDSDQEESSMYVYPMQKFYGLQDEYTQKLVDVSCNARTGYISLLVETKKKTSEALTQVPAQNYLFNLNGAAENRPLGRIHSILQVAAKISKISATYYPDSDEVIVLGLSSEGESKSSAFGFNPQGAVITVDATSTTSVGDKKLDIHMKTYTGTTGVDTQLNIKFVEYLQTASMKIIEGKQKIESSTAEGKSFKIEEYMELTGPVSSAVYKSKAKDSKNTLRQRMIENKDLFSKLQGDSLIGFVISEDADYLLTWSYTNVAMYKIDDLSKVLVSLDDVAISSASFVDIVDSNGEQRTVALFIGEQNSKDKLFAFHWGTKDEKQAKQWLVGKCENLEQGLEDANFGVITNTAKSQNFVLAAKNNKETFAVTYVTFLVIGEDIILNQVPVRHTFKSSVVDISAIIEDTDILVVASIQHEDRLFFAAGEFSKNQGGQLREINSVWRDIVSEASGDKEHLSSIDTKIDCEKVTSEIESHTRISCALFNNEMQGYITTIQFNDWRDVADAGMPLIATDGVTLDRRLLNLRESKTVSVKRVGNLALVTSTGRPLASNSLSQVAEDSNYYVVLYDTLRSSYPFAVLSSADLGIVIPKVDIASLETAKGPVTTIISVSSAKRAAFELHSLKFTVNEAKTIDVAEDTFEITGLNGLKTSIPLSSLFTHTTSSSPSSSPSLFRTDSLLFWVSISVVGLISLLLLLGLLYYFLRPTNRGAQHKLTLDEEMEFKDDQSVSEYSKL